MDQIAEQITALTGLPVGTFMVLALIVLGAAIVRGLTGFGFAILAVPLIGLVIAPAQAVLLAIVLQMLIGPFGVRIALPHIDRPLVARIAALAFLFTPLGLWLLTRLDMATARLVIAGIAFACFFGFLIKREPTPPKGALSILITGAVSGVLNGFAAMPGPPVILFFVRDQVPPLVARGSMMLVFFAAAISGTLAAGWRGLLDATLLWLVVASFPLMLVGNHLGTRFFGRVPERVWRGIVIALLGVAMIGAAARI
jgi:uncharacterized membrane protein YfcA